MESKLTRKAGLGTNSILRLSSKEFFGLVNLYQLPKDLEYFFVYNFILSGEFYVCNQQMFNLIFFITDFSTS